MNRFWIAMRASDCAAPENGTPVYNGKKNLYACSSHAAAVELAEEKTETEGGIWLVFQLTRIVTATAQQSIPEEG